MPGSFIRVVTVTHHGHVTPGTGRRPAVISKRIEERPASPLDAAPAWHWLMSWPTGGLGCPCGAAAFSSDRSAMAQLVVLIGDYAARWGANPMGTDGRHRSPNRYVKAAA